MAPSLQRLLAEVSARHFPNPPATPEQLAAFEAHAGWKLDEDLRAFYLHCNGATLFAPLPDVNYHLLPLERIKRARVAILGRDEDSAGAAAYYCVVDMQDGDYVLVDVAQPKGGNLPLFDAWHETYPEVRRVASSFGEFLEKALRSGNRAFWLSSEPSGGEQVVALPCRACDVRAVPSHDKTMTLPERRRALAGTTVRIDGLLRSREAWARVGALTAQLLHAGIPRARPSGALELLVLHPEVASQVLAGGCRVYRCATCEAWLDAASAISHQDGLPGHEVQGFAVTPG